MRVISHRDHPSRLIRLQTFGMLKHATGILTLTLSIWVSSELNI